RAPQGCREARVVPRAAGSIVAPQKYMYLDHDTAHVDPSPVVQNELYTVFEAEDVRLLWCVVMQDNGTAAIKGVGVRWTIDGNEYSDAESLDAGTYYYVYRNYWSIADGAAELDIVDTELNAGFNVDKRGHSVKVEVDIVQPPGADQRLQCWCVYETLEET
ncbi:unnamed protein product, partial [marine sediment metagenome]